MHLVINDKIMRKVYNFCVIIKIREERLGEVYGDTIVERNIRPICTGSR